MRPSIPLAVLVAISVPAGARSTCALTFEVGPGKTLAIRSARPPYSFTGPSGAVESYPNNASTIYLEFGENITVRNCALHDSGNGFFAFSSDQVATRNVLVEGNYIYDNGNDGSIFEHNVYTEALGITFQYNHLGPLRAGAGGNNLK